MSFDPCASCRRHVAAHERECPFCGAAPAAVVARSAPLAGRLSRAAVFAGLTACWSGNDAVQRQTPPRPPPIDAPVAEVTAWDTSAVLSGVVTEAGTRIPVANVTVELRDANGRVAATNTDDRGAYEFVSLAPGDYQLVLKYSGADAVGSTQQPVSVREIPGRTDIALPMLRRAPIAKPYGAPPARRRIV